MPRGTQNTPIRLTEEDRAMIRAIQKRMGLPSLASAVRYAIRITYECDMDRIAEALLKNSEDDP